MKDFAKTYNPSEIEKKWSEFWKQNHCFQGNPLSAKQPFSIVMPPPNVTGTLHMGHALDDTLQDLFTRYHRMMGKEALWIPGTDHAGIATQTVVEKHLIKTLGKRRKDFSRDEFLQFVWKWKEEKGSLILQQIERVGASCDWSRLGFTMDKQRNRAVRYAFKKLFDDQLIYRGDYLVNWDPITQTALADDEVEYEERDTFLWYFRYPLRHDKNHTVVIATTRPETMLGDTALAVSPKDSRFSSIIGKEVLLPFVQRAIPILADPFVDPAFGSGVVKITPAHDPNDYEVAQRHNLPMINIMTPDGRINELGGEFAGLSMEEARKAIVQRMKELDLLEKIVPYKTKVGISYRSQAVIEPYLSKQWFIRMEPFKKKLIDAVRERRVRLHPALWESTYFHWVENLRDWCISRQLWWGHRIPIWYHRSTGQMLCFAEEGLPHEVEKDPSSWTQDEDVLDTWFSSALWPLSALGWPDSTPELKKFYPLSLLITGYEILFFWVARMMMMGEYLLHEVPFHEVFLHGLIFSRSYWRTSSDGTIHYASAQEKASFDQGDPIPPDVMVKWEKMSKSKSNVIDPLDLIQIYGTDALRFSLASITTFSRQLELDLRRFEEAKNFTNKIWNAARFVFFHMQAIPEKNLPEFSSAAFSTGLDSTLFTLDDRWILSRWNRLIAQTHHHLTQYAIDKVASSLYEFFWDDFCAYYLELAKPTLFGANHSLRKNKQKMLLIILGGWVRLMHPLMPFITEEIFSLLREQLSPISLSQSLDPYSKDFLQSLQSSSCMVAPYPKVLEPHDLNPKVEEEFTQLCELLRTIRNIRTEMQIAPGSTIDLFLWGQKEILSLFRQNESALTHLAKVGSISYVQKESDLPSSGSKAAIGTTKIVIPIPNELREKEKARLQKEQEKLAKSLKQMEEKLASPDFLAKAPKHIVDKMQEAFAQTKEVLLDIGKKLRNL